MSREKVRVVSVVRDWEMYERCVANNLNLNGCQLIGLDNREKNESVSVLYNRTLEEIGDDKNQWLIFCHEDFQFQEPMTRWLDRMDKNSVYGPIGGVTLKRWHWLFGEIWSGAIRGSVEECEKDGSGVRNVGCPVPFGVVADALDCQCVIVHSSLVVDYHLRFDEMLSFDLYAEDFCMNAFCAHGILTRILPVKCRHFSRGTIAPRFIEQLSYLERKYPKYEAFGPVGYMVGTGRTCIRRMQKRLRRYMNRHMKWLLSILFRLVG